MKSLICLVIFGVFADAFSMNYQNWRLQDIVLNKDSTIQDVDDCLKKGANIEQLFAVCIDSRTMYIDMYTYAFEEKGRSPVEGDLPEGIYAGKKEVADYVFCLLLEKKLDRVIQSCAFEEKDGGTHEYWLEPSQLTWHKWRMAYDTWPTAIEDEWRELVQKMK